MPGQRRSGSTYCGTLTLDVCLTLHFNTCFRPGPRTGLAPGTTSAAQSGEWRALLHLVWGFPSDTEPRDGSWNRHTAGGPGDRPMRPTLPMMSTTPSHLPHCPALPRAPISRYSEPFFAAARRRPSSSPPVDLSYCILPHSHLFVTFRPSRPTAVPLRICTHIFCFPTLFAPPCQPRVPRFILWVCGNKAKVSRFSSQVPGLSHWETCFQQ